jgi:hypothetical protein
MAGCSSVTGRDIMNDLALNDELARTMLDAVPLPMFVVDRDLRIFDGNTAGTRFMGGETALLCRLRGGEAMYCLHAAEAAEGCGSTEHCNDCVIRNCVTASFQGRQLVRQRARMQLAGKDGPRAVELLVTTTPFEHGNDQLVLLILEDITELSELRSLLPICSRCKKIRDDKDYWHQLEAYLTTRLNVGFTHSLCPDCVAEFLRHSPSNYGPPDDTGMGGRGPE